MKVFSPAVSFLSTQQISSVKNFELYRGVKSFSYLARLPMRLFSYLLGLEEVDFFIIKTENQKSERRLLDDLKKDGLIDSFREFPLYSDYPKLYGLGITYTPINNILGKQLTTWGYVRLNEDKKEAYNKAIGELIERNAEFYAEGAHFFYPKITTRNVSFLYDLIPHFTQLQIKKNLDIVASKQDLSNVRCITVVNLINTTKTLLPISFFYWGGIRKEGEKIFSQETSSGGGGGVTKESSFLSAVYELIERDHFLLYWFSGFNPEILDNTTIPGEFGRFVKSTEEEYGLDVFFLDIRYDVKISVCACVVIDPVLNLISIGAKASSSPIESLRGSLIESLAVIMNLREKGDVTDEFELKEILQEKSFNKNVDPEKRVTLYCNEYGISLIKKSFLSGSRKIYSTYATDVQSFSSKKEEVLFIVDEFKKLIEKKGKGYCLYSHQLNTLYTKRFKYSVTKVFVPAFIKLHLTERLACPVSERLTSFAREHGVFLGNESEINTLPHFFP